MVEELYFNSVIVFFLQFLGKGIERISNGFYKDDVGDKGKQDEGCLLRQILVCRVKQFFFKVMQIFNIGLFLVVQNVYGVDDNI